MLFFLNLCVWQIDSLKNDKNWIFRRNRGNPFSLLQPNCSSKHLLLIYPESLKKNSNRMRLRKCLNRFEFWILVGYSPILKIALLYHILDKSLDWLHIMERLYDILSGTLHNGTKFWSNVFCLNCSWSLMFEWFDKIRVVRRNENGTTFHIDIYKLTYEASVETNDCLLFGLQLFQIIRNNKM